MCFFLLGTVGDVVFSFSPLPREVGIWGSEERSDPEEGLASAFFDSPDTTRLDQIVLVASSVALMFLLSIFVLISLFFILQDRSF